MKIHTADPQHTIPVEVSTDDPVHLKKPFHAKPFVAERAKPLRIITSSPSPRVSKVNRQQCRQIHPPASVGGGHRQGLPIDGWSSGHARLFMVIEGLWPVAWGSPVARNDPLKRSGSGTLANMAPVQKNRDLFKEKSKPDPVQSKRKSRVEITPLFAQYNKNIVLRVV